MGLAIETVAGYVNTAASATAQAMAAGNQQSFNVRATNGATGATLGAMWTDFQDAGFFRVRSPRLHDDVNGIEVYSALTNPNPVAIDVLDQPLFSQDSLTVEAYFIAAPTVNHYAVGALQIYYPDLPGVAGNFMSWAQIAPMIQSYMGVYVQPISNATLGQWGTGVAINSSQDVFKANGAYALLGYISPVAVPIIAVQGTDLGNLYVGGPGSIDPIVTRSWFKDQDIRMGVPSIPVINSQNKGSTLASVFGAIASTTYTVSLLFAYLGPWQGAGG